jgi:hypothetical protein
MERKGTPDPTTQHSDLQALRETGATGLEPATSGVTGRKRPSGADRGYAGIRRESRAFHPLLTGDLRAPAGVSDDLVAGCARDGSLSLGDVGQRQQSSNACVDGDDRDQPVCREMIDLLLTMRSTGNRRQGRARTRRLRI